MNIVSMENVQTAVVTFGMVYYLCKFQQLGITGVLFVVQQRFMFTYTWLDNCKSVAMV